MGLFQFLIKSMRSFRTRNARCSEFQKSQGIFFEGNRASACPTLNRNKRWIFNAIDTQKSSGAQTVLRSNLVAISAKYKTGLAFRNLRLLSGIRKSASRFLASDGIALAERGCEGSRGIHPTDGHNQR
jgi:hypothetical protein